VLFDIESFDFFYRGVGWSCVSALNKSAFNCAWHDVFIPRQFEFLLVRLFRPFAQVYSMKWKDPRTYT